MPRSAVDRVMRSDQPRRPPHWRQLVTLPSPSRSTSTVGALATAAGGLVSPIVPSLAAQHYHDHEPIVRELERRIRLFIAHFDKSRSWRFVVPGADKPWPGHIVIPKPNRNGALHKGSTVMVWDATVLVTSIVNNAIVPLMTLPVIDSKVNQLVVEHKDGLSDLWVYERVELDGLRRPFHAHWTLQDFRGQNVKVEFVSSAHPDQHSASQSAAPEGPSNGGPSSPAHPAGALVSLAAQRDRSTSLDATAAPDSSPPPAPPSYTPPHPPRWSQVFPRGEIEDHDGGSTASSSSTCRPERQTLLDKPPRGDPDATEETQDRSPSDRSMRPAGQPYSSWPEAVYSRRSPPPTLTDKTVEKLALRIRAFLQWKDAGVAYRGGSVGDKDVHVGDFHWTFLPVDGHEQGRYVLDVQVRLKGIWTPVSPEKEDNKFPFGSAKRLAFTLPGATLDPREEHTRTCSLQQYRDQKGRYPFTWTARDQWTFSSRAGREISSCNVPTSTTWTFESTEAARGKKKGPVPLVYVTFMLDEEAKPFEVRQRNANLRVAVFALSRKRRARAALQAIRREQEGRVFE